MLEKYKLELHWGALDKQNLGKVKLRDAYFSGPVLNDAEHINSNDTIRLDFTPQFSKVLTSYYFVDLIWSSVKYSKGRVYLSDVFLLGEYFYDLPSLLYTDYIIIDTEMHDGEKHLYNLVYKSYIVTREGVEK